jgi:hypothetical protein
VTMLRWRRWATLRWRWSSAVSVTSWRWIVETFRRKIVTSFGWGVAFATLGRNFTNDVFSVWNDGATVVATGGIVIVVVWFWSTFSMMLVVRRSRSRLFPIRSFRFLAQFSAVKVTLELKKQAKTLLLSHEVTIKIFLNITNLKIQFLQPKFFS